MRLIARRGMNQPTASLARRLTCCQYLPYSRPYLPPYTALLTALLRPPRTAAHQSSSRRRRGCGWRASRSTVTRAASRRCCNVRRRAKRAKLQRQAAVTIQRAWRDYAESTLADISHDLDFFAYRLQRTYREHRDRVTEPEGLGVLQLVKAATGEDAGEGAMEEVPKRRRGQGCCGRRCTEAAATAAAADAAAGTAPPPQARQVAAPSAASRARPRCKRCCSLRGAAAPVLSTLHATRSFRRRTRMTA